jgi:RNA polymerase sigma-70 factor (ECF subfamily)
MGNEPGVSSVAEQAVTDAALIARVRSRDANAMAAIYDRYSSIVYSVALRVLGETSAAEDVMQEIFMQLWRKPQLFNSSRGSMGAWLAVIARNRAIDALRRRKPETVMEDVVLASAVDLVNTTERNVIVAKVRQIISGMPSEQQRALQMAFFEGLTHSEIAERTGEPLGTIKTRIRSGLIHIRKGLAV